MTNELNQRPLADDEIDLLELFTTLWRGKWIIIAFTFVFAIGSVIYALGLPNIYKAEAVLAPSEESSGSSLAAMAGQLGGLASLAGVNLGGDDANKTTIALEILQSRAFLTEFVEKHDILPEIMAVSEWNPEQGILFNEEIYNATSKTWVRQVEAPKQSQPTSWEYVKTIKRDLLQVSQDKETGLVTISISHQSPVFSKKVAELLVKAINDKMRQRDIVEAQNSLEYLNQELKTTNLSNMQQVFYELIEKQTQTMMLANVRPEYIFQTIDPAVIPEEKFKPKRSLIVILGFMLGCLIGTMFVLVRHFFKENVNRNEKAFEKI